MPVLSERLRLPWECNRMQNFEKLLMQVEKPARYTGGEYNTPDLNKENAVRFCLCFVDIYEVAMSNAGIAILYDILNSDENIIAERCFAPWVDMGKLLKERNIPLMSIETKTPIKDFDIVGMSLQYEMGYTNILYMLELAGIPYRAESRDDSYPLLVAGGPCTANPEPFADFFDVIFIGDGEDVDRDFCYLVKKYGKDKKKILSEAAKIDGMYVPSLMGSGKKGLKKSVVKDLDKARYPVKPLIPNIEIIHDRSAIELYRGCYAGCRFCQACFFYRPIRYREKPTVTEIAEQLLKNTGCEEIGLSSLSTGDYENIYEIIREIKEKAESRRVSLQLPSLRLDSLTSELIGSSRRSSLTFAPEAGTQRLRNVINKNITDEDIESSMRIAFEIGYRTVKLYFMLGLPTETDEDVLGIAEIVRKIKSIYFEVRKNKQLVINVSTAMFIPKPLTPFQWAEQISMEEMLRKQVLLRNELKKIKNVNYSWHGAEVTVLEGMFARGDRRLSRVVESAYKNGCYFDGWSEHFNNDGWQAALQENSIDPRDYVRARGLDEPFPWDFIDFGVTKDYLKKEYLKALEEKTTPPCKHNCNGCGASALGKCRMYLTKKESGSND